jgi:hypothetical protein
MDDVDGHCVQRMVHGFKFRVYNYSFRPIEK